MPLRCHLGVYAIVEAEQDKTLQYKTTEVLHRLLPILKTSDFWLAGHLLKPSGLEQEQRA